MEILDSNLTLGTFIGKITTKMISWKEGSLMFERILHQKKHPVIFLNLAFLLLRNKKKSNLTLLFFATCDIEQGPTIEANAEILVSCRLHHLPSRVLFSVGYTVGNLTSKPDRDVLIPKIFMW